MNKLQIGYDDFTNEYVDELVKKALLGSGTRLRDVQTSNQLANIIREDVNVHGGIDSIFELKKIIFNCFARYGFYDAAFSVAQNSNEKEEP